MPAGVMEICNVCAWAFLRLVSFIMCDKLSHKLLISSQNEYEKKREIIKAKFPLILNRKKNDDNYDDDFFFFFNGRKKDIE